MMLAGQTPSARVRVVGVRRCGWALGLLVYCTLAGETPFANEAEGFVWRVWKVWMVWGRGLALVWNNFREKCAETWGNT